MSTPLVINKSKHRHEKSFLIKNLESVGGCLVQVLLVVVRIICQWYYKDYHVKLPKIEDPIITESVEELAEKIRKQKITSEQLVRAYIKRIEQTNGTLNYMAENRFTEAIAEAVNADQLISSGAVDEAYLKKEKPLFGIPFTTKDAIKVKGMQNTCGLIPRRNIKAENDAESTKNLRDAGAIPIGLTNVPEACMWWETYNKLFGRTKNPYDNARIVGGSSGGEGCIQGAAGSAFGLGADIGGSIRMPSLFNGVFGHKPSKYIVSIEGHFPEPSTDLQASFLGLGPMCRKATDLKLLLKVMGKSKSVSKLSLDEKVNLKNVKVFYQRNSPYNPLVMSVDKSTSTALENAVSHMDSVCKVKSQEVIFEKFSDSMNIWVICMNLYDFAHNLRPNINVTGLFLELLKSIFGKSEFCFITLLNNLVYKTYPRQNSEKYHNTVKTRNELEKEFVELLGKDGVFFYPTHPSSAPYHNETLVRAFGVGYTGITSTLGLPITHVPLGLDEEGLPIGIQVVSGFNNDRLCLAVAEELERAFGGWKDPSQTRKNM